MITIINMVMLIVSKLILLMEHICKGELCGQTASASGYNVCVCVCAVCRHASVFLCVCVCVCVCVCLLFVSSRWVASKKRCVSPGNSARADIDACSDVKTRGRATCHEVKKKESTTHTHTHTHTHTP